MKGDLISPVGSKRSVESRHLERAEIHKLMKPVTEDFLKFVKSQDSISQWSLAVNDSAAGKVFDECYESLCVLGEGGFAFVYRCRHLVGGKTYAVKEIIENDYERECMNFKEKVDALKRLRDVPYIVRLLDVFTDIDRSYLVMEEMRGGDLLDRLEEIEVYSERDARKASRKLLEAVFFCHKKKIVHRDIKPENILLTSHDNNTDIKLADFGCAKLITGKKRLHTLCGSPQYVAPELYLFEEGEGYDERCDLWSAAVVIFVLLGGYAPFDAPDEELPSCICSGKYKFHDAYWKDVSKNPKDLIASLLKVDPDDRATLEDALDSEWLRRRDRDFIFNMSMSGSCSTFDAWVRSQNDSSQSINSDSSQHSSRDSMRLSMHGSHHSFGSVSLSLDFHEEGDENEDSSRSLSVEDLMGEEEADLRS